MKVRCIISLFLLILCTQSLTGSCLEDFPTLKSQDFNIIAKFQLHDGVNLTNMNESGERRRRIEENNNEAVGFSRKAQGRKGTYGGGNNAHHPRSNNKNSATPCLFISTLPLILMVLFYFNIINLVVEL
ncbi:hypothetical protein Dsin_013138 [Dipteronia sinensis]|uniref:Transmembrane protein n=1 Tax=Dipteronia sinensis TaxID=43782 RepID=A0AAE0AJU7_9ROSI|nr:hypothetical protein Dsin_013138 [Dipteronia sinensis]